MSKTTKALAILGVVAGLGVAALPFNAMAAITNEIKTEGAGDGASISAEDSVLVKTTIKDYIAIEINPDTDENNKGTLTSDESEGSTEENPKHDHTLDLGELMNGGTVSGSLLVNVKTNNSKGYNLGVKAAAANMVGALNSAHTIAGGAPAANTSAWGFMVAANGTNEVTVAGSYGTWGAVPSDQNTTIATYDEATDNDGVDAKVTFGVSADASQAADTYSQTVTFTAATNPVVTTPEEP